MVRAQTRMPKANPINRRRVRVVQVERSCPIRRGPLSTAWTSVWAHSGVTFGGPTAARPVLKALHSAVCVAVQPIQNGAFIKESQFSALRGAPALSEKEHHLASGAQIGVVRLAVTSLQFLSLCLR